MAASYEQAAVRAGGLGANTMQIFTSSPRMWRASMPARDDVIAFLRMRAQFGITPLVVHCNYLINLASADPGIREKSVAAYRGEIERALFAGADYLVVHPGSAKGQPVELAMASVAIGMREAAAGLGSDRLMLLLENTAGQGNALGADLAELARIRELAGDIGFETGYCIDTAHSFAAGHAIHEEAGLEEFLSVVDRTLGWNRIPVIHTNDSKAPFASRVDRHHNIGQGYIGEKAFASILQHPLTQNKAFILETPEEEGGGHALDISTLKRLCRKNRTNTAESK